jgi:hypothetical protein
MRRSARGARRLRRAAFGLPVAMLLSVAASQSRAEAAYDILTGIGETDNVRLTPDDRRSDTIALLGIDLTWHEQRRWFDGDATGDLEYLDYLRHTFDREVVGNFLGDLHLNLIPQVLRWTFDDNFGQGRIDPAAAVTPANRENINYFNTGPDLTLPLGYTNELLVDARYGNVHYQTSPLSSNRYSATVGVRHELSADSGISINVEDEALRFDNSILNPDYDEQQAYARFDAKGARTQLAFDLGYNRLKLENGSTGGPLARLELTRQLTVSSNLTATLGRAYSDAGDDFRMLQALGGATLATQSVQATGNPFRQDYVTLGWNFQRNRTGFGLQGGYFKLSYIGSSILDEHRATGSANVTRRLTPGLELSVSANYIREDFLNQPGNYSQFDAIAQLTWRASSRVSFLVELARSHRESDLNANSYSDDRAWLKVRYGRSLPPPTQPKVPALPAFPNEPRY